MAAPTLPAPAARFQPPPIAPPSNIRRILDESASEYGVTVDDMLGQSTRLRFVGARRLAAVKLRERGMSLTRIAQILGRRHHTTVLNLINTPEPAFARRRVAVVQEWNPDIPDLSGEWAI